jgi:hypothetical protein
MIFSGRRRDSIGSPPWQTADEGEPIRVECAGLGHGLRFAVILGKLEKTKGLMLYDDWES